MMSIRTISRLALFGIILASAAFRWFDCHSAFYSIVFSGADNDQPFAFIVQAIALLCSLAGVFQLLRTGHVTPAVRKTPFWAMFTFFIIAMLLAMGGQSLGCLHQGAIVAGMAAFILLFIGNAGKKI